MVAVDAGVGSSSLRLRARPSATTPADPAEQLEHVAWELARLRRAGAGRRRGALARRHRCSGVCGWVSGADSTTGARRAGRHPVRARPPRACVAARRGTCRPGRLAADGDRRRTSCWSGCSRTGDHLRVDPGRACRAERGAGADVTALGRPRSTCAGASRRRVAPHPPHLAHRLRLLRPRPDARGS